MAPSQRVKRIIGNIKVNKLRASLNEQKANLIIHKETLVRPQNFEISTAMKVAISAAGEGENLFISGRAGTGKSTLLTYLREEVLRDSLVVLAPTGVAAINIGGLTIHKFFSFFPDITFQHIDSKDYHPENLNVMKILKTLVIDEISMVRADLLDCVDMALRKFGPKSSLPFGGVQVIFVGDLFQLSPIVRRSEVAFLNSHYKTPFFFSSSVYQKIQINKVQLHKIYRQNEVDFIKILNEIRVDRTSEATFELLNTRVVPNFEKEKGKFFITLVSTNALAYKINEKELSNLNSPIEVSHALITGDLSKSEYPAESEISMCEGSQIMMLNNERDNRWVNGTLATIQSINCGQPGEDPIVRIKLIGTEVCHEVTKTMWEVKRPKSEGNVLVYDTVGTFTQFPFMLAWAITIHKSQGKTFENVIIDLSTKAFAAGQLYVALSRCTTLGGLVLKRHLDASHVIVDERVRDFYNSEGAMDD
jgi:ATP-dependent DNA helicase PIF1